MLDWQTMTRILFGRPRVFFRHLSTQPFARGLPRPDETQSSDAIRVFKKAILYHGVWGLKLKRKIGDFNKLLRTFAAMDGCMKRNQVRILIMCFPVQYIGDRCLSKPRYLSFFFFLALLIAHSLGIVTSFTWMQSVTMKSNTAHHLIWQLRTSSISDAFSCQMPPAQWEKYVSHWGPMSKRTLSLPNTNTSWTCYAVPRVRNWSKHQRQRDDWLLVEQKEWGLELLRGRDRLVEHMERFEHEGQYYSMIKSREWKSTLSWISQFHDQWKPVQVSL